MKTNAVRTERGIWVTTTLLLASGAAMTGMSLIGTRWRIRSVPKVPVLVQFLSSLGRRFPLLLQGMPRAEQGFSRNQVAGTMALLIPLMIALLGRVG